MYFYLFLLGFVYGLLFQESFNLRKYYLSWLYNFGLEIYKKEIYKSVVDWVGMVIFKLVLSLYIIISF